MHPIELKLGGLSFLDILRRREKEFLKSEKIGNSAEKNQRAIAFAFFGCRIFFSWISIFLVSFERAIHRKLRSQTFSSIGPLMRSQWPSEVAETCRETISRSFVRRRGVPLDIDSRSAAAGGRLVCEHYGARSEALGAVVVELCAICRDVARLDVHHRSPVTWVWSRPDLHSVFRPAP